MANPMRRTSRAYPAEDDLALAHVLADTAAAIAIGQFRQTDLQTSRKTDGSPVTEADWLIEATLREQLRQRRPDDAFVGEESGGVEQRGRRWYIDPIDGTASFMAGRAHWRTLIAVEDAGAVTMGLVSSPMLHRRWWATRGGGAWTLSFDPDGTADALPTRLAVTRTRRLAEAAVAIWPDVTDLPMPLRGSGARLAANSRPPLPEPKTSNGVRHGALLVATGLIDAFVFAGAGPWDLAAMVPIVEEAGGRFSDMTGGRSLRTPAAVFSNGVLHEQIEACFRRER